MADEPCLEEQIKPSAAEMRHVMTNTRHGNLTNAEVDDFWLNKIKLLTILG